MDEREEMVERDGVEAGHAWRDLMLVHYKVCSCDGQGNKRCYVSSEYSGLSQAFMDAYNVFFPSPLSPSLSLPLFLFLSSPPLPLLLLPSLYLIIFLKRTTSNA